MASYASTFIAARAADLLAAVPALPLYLNALHGRRAVTLGHQPGIGADLARLASPTLTPIDSHVEPAVFAAPGSLARARAAAAKIYDATAKNWS